MARLVRSFIYGLVGECGHIRYVGQTSNPLRRYRQHCLLSNNTGDTHRQNWLRCMLKKGARPAMVLLETTDTPNSAERRWIKALPNLVNSDITINQSKEQLPWGRHHSPFQKRMLAIGRTVRFLREAGHVERADLIQSKAERAAECGRVKASGREAWVEFNRRLADV